MAPTQIAVRVGADHPRAHFAERAMGSATIVSECFQEFKRHVGACSRCGKFLVPTNEPDMWAGELHATARCFLDISRPASHQYSPNERDLTTAAPCRGENACAISRWENDFFNALNPIGQGLQENCEGMRSQESAAPLGHPTRSGDMTPYRSSHLGGVDGDGRFRWPFLSENFSGEGPNHAVS